MNICGICGHNIFNENSLCAKCGGDYIIQPQDFDNPELKNYIQLACKILHLTRNELRGLTNKVK